MLVSSPVHLRVGTYNVENMFDDVNDPHKDDDDMEPKSERSLQVVADTLRRVDADVVALQEVENVEVLQDFLDEHLPGMYPNVVLVEGNDNRGIDVAFISKHPITRVETHKDDRFPIPNQSQPGFFKRDLLEVSVKLPEGPTVDLYATHLKSHGGGQAADEQRLGEATQIRNVLRDDYREDPDRFRIVMGDMNDTPPTPTIRAILTPGEGQVKDSLAGKPFQERDTHPAGAPRRSLDFILYSDNLKEEFKEARVHRFPEARQGSDHYMVSADFLLTA